MSNSNKKGKSVARSHSNVGSLKEAASGSSSEAGTNMEDNQGQISFENTPFGQLLGEINISDKGQLVSKCPFGVIVWTKIQMKKLLP